MAKSKNPVGLVGFIIGRCPFIVVAGVLGLAGCAVAPRVDMRIASSDNLLPLPLTGVSSGKLPAMLPNSVSKCPSVIATFHRDDDGKDYIRNYIGGPKLGDCYRQLPNGDLVETIVTLFPVINTSDLSYAEDDETLSAWNTILTGTVSSVSYKDKETEFVGGQHNIYYNRTYPNKVDFLGYSHLSLNGEDLKVIEVLYTSHRTDGSKVNERKYKFALLSDGSILLAEIAKTLDSSDNIYPMPGWHTQHLTNLEYKKPSRTQLTAFN